MGRNYDRDTRSTDEEVSNQNHYHRREPARSSENPDRLTRSTTPVLDYDTPRAAARPLYVHDRRVSGLASTSGDSNGERVSRGDSESSSSKKRVWEQVEQSNKVTVPAVVKTVTEIPLVMTPEQIVENFRRHQAKKARQQAVVDSQQAVLDRLANKTGYETPSDDEMTENGSETVKQSVSINASSNSTISQGVSPKKSISTGISSNSFKKARPMVARNKFNAAFIPTSLKCYGHEVPVQNPVGNDGRFDAHGYKLAMSIGHQNLVNVRSSAGQVTREELCSAVKYAGQIMIDACSVWVDRFVTDDELTTRYGGFITVDTTNSHVRLLTKRNQKDFFTFWFKGVIQNPRGGISAGHLAQMVTNLLVWSGSDIPTAIININRGLKGLTGKHYRKCEKTS